MNNNKNLLCIDWGTSSLRAYLVAQNGTIIEQKSFPWGVKKLPFNTGVRQDDFEKTFLRLCENWVDVRNIPILICGMATSAMGLKEVPYVNCPASINDIAKGLSSCSVGDINVHLIPGLLSNITIPDVMRGEETQIFGSIDNHKPVDKLICLPGTHSKWAIISKSYVVDFKTMMTGEVFDLLCKHSILLDPENNGAFNQEAFLKGVRININNDNLLSTLFSTRTLNLQGMLEKSHQKSYLSGLIIGNEIHQINKYINEAQQQFSQITLIGEASLCALYELAISTLMVNIKINHDEHAAVKCMWNLAKTKGLI